MPNSPTQQHVYARVVVNGRVQGVGYRAFTRHRASAKGLSGGVRNLETGQVEVEIEGEKAVIEDLVSDLRKGPVGSYVIHVHVEWGAAADRFHGFQIWY
jgi:acylphosphatase